MIRELELLAPAKNLEYGIAAINYGADAVYIGGHKFGARSAVGNSMEDIRQLADHAHQFGAKVYLALNTVLFEDELKQAEKIVLEAWEAGVDALIIQDMAFLEMDLPPIPLFASTQTFNMSPGQVRFLQDSGFARVILERALSLDGIKDIRKDTDVDLEVFVHGAICVCYSGRCYMSQAVAGRSGNRGECVQPCRSDYNLKDEDGKILMRNKHLLSVMDLNLSDNLEELIDAGVTSFKIEGRLKELSYLKNSVSYYRGKLDNIISRRNDLRRSSLGENSYDFVPDPDKSFSRGFTGYYLNGQNNKVASFDTPKAIGQYIGKIKSVSKDSFTVGPGAPLANGDGISFFSASGQHAGTNINKVDGERIYPNKMTGISPGVEIYRNHDHVFTRVLETSKTTRAITLSAEINIEGNRISLKYTDPEGVEAEISAEMAFEPARDESKAKDSLRQQAAKTGGTIYRVENVNFKGNVVPFVPASVINGLRRDALEELHRKRLEGYRRETRKAATVPAAYPQKSLDYTANITNSLSEKFYRERGVENIEKGLEITREYKGKAVMRTKYCIRREMGECLKEKECKYKGKLFLENNCNIFELRFDCGECEMTIVTV